MRSSLVLAALFFALLLAAGVNALARGPGGSQTAAQQATSDCAVTLHRKYDYSGRLYIQKVRVCRMAGDA